MKRIVVAVDGSEPADEALETALELAEEHAAHVWLVHAQVPTDVIVGSYLGPAVAVPAEYRLTAEEDDVLQRAAAVAAEHGVEATPVERLGASGEEIVAVADEVDADMVVIGSRGLRTLGRVVLGSTSREVLRRTRRPVLVVRVAPVPVVA